MKNSLIIVVTKRHRQELNRADAFGSMNIILGDAVHDLFTDWTKWTVNLRGMRVIEFQFTGEILRTDRRRGIFTIETMMEIDNDKDMMAVQAAHRGRKDHLPKKSSTERKAKEGGAKNVFCVVSEHSLSGFLEDEPDIYSVADLKVRYR